MSNSIQELQGTVERIVYTNPENGFVVFVVCIANTKNQITVQGSASQLHAGQLVNLQGEWKVHPKFGKQFNATRCAVQVPTSVAGLEKYLSSGVIKGIGPSYAHRLVERFGCKVLEIIDKFPERLSTVPGIGAKRCGAIMASWKEQKEISHLMLFFQDKGISITYATKIYKRYGLQTLDVVTENPYRLASEVWGIGFKLADQLAKGMGFSHEGSKRICAGILHALSTMTLSGSLYAEDVELSQKTFSLLELVHESRQADFSESLDQLHGLGKVCYVAHNSKNLICLAQHYFSEKGCADLLSALQSARTPLLPDIDDVYAKWSISGHVDLHGQQQEAILMALSNKVSIVTGGPGTGKTTVIKSIVQMLDDNGITYQLAAPTGRAAKRMMQATKKAALTIHRLLEFDPNVMRFTRNEKNKLDVQCIIIDETSMIDIFLAHALLKSVPQGAHIVFIGDVDQLPSVGPGNFLADMLSSGKMAHTRLVHIFRQAENSLIVANAHRINTGMMPVLNLPNCKRDFFFIKEDNPENIPSHLAKIYRNYLPSCAIAADESILLSAMNKGTAGTITLNHDLQSLLNPTAYSSPALSYAGTRYALGDRVMQIKNNYDKAVFNGDVGTVVRVDMELQVIDVLFFEQVVTYQSNELDEVMLAYAISIHKSQGSEYQAVIIVLFMQHFMLLARNLVYTALTRAQKVCIVIGQYSALSAAIGNVSGANRVTLLKEFLHNSSP